MKRLIINLDDITEIASHISGQLDGVFEDLPDYDAKPSGLVDYEFQVQRFEDELLLTGYLSAPFTFTCTGCLVEYEQVIILENAAIAQEIEAGGDVDATEALREEVLIHFPGNPRCTDSPDFEQCNVDSRYLAVDKSPSDAVETPPTPKETDHWGALDALKSDLPDTPDQS